MLGEDQIGTIFIRSDTQAVMGFLLNTIGILVAVLIVSFITCWLFSWSMRLPIQEISITPGYFSSSII